MTHFLPKVQEGCSGRGVVPEVCQCKAGDCWERPEPGPRYGPGTLT